MIGKYLDPPLLPLLQIREPNLRLISMLWLLYVRVPYSSFLVIVDAV